MAFIRPEIKEGVWRWREALLGAGVSACGAFLAVAQTGLLSALGLSFAIVGALLIFAGIQRTRFRVGSGGPGIVQVHERLVTYYGPLEGGSVSVNALERVILDPTARPAAWVLTEIGGQTLRIPTHAENADALFDVFATLDGIRTEHMLAQLQANRDAPVPIWQNPERKTRAVAVQSVD